MKNYWIKDKIVAKGHPFWTFEVFDAKKEVVVKETIVHIDEKPSMKIMESLEVEEDGRTVWKPVLVIWERFEATYTDAKFLESHSHLRLLEADGNAVGILRHYDEGGEHVESWVMHRLKIEDVDSQESSLKATFTFHHAVYLADDLNVLK